MFDIDGKIRELDDILCENIDLIDFKSRAFVAQNLLQHTRNLVEYVAIKAYSLKNPVENDGYNIKKAALEFIKQDQKFLFMRKFHYFLQESVSHYTPDNDGAERLTIKYYEYYVILRDFVKSQYGLDILHNLERFPVNQDKAVVSYYREVLYCLDDIYHQPGHFERDRFYVIRSKPVSVDGRVLYENTLIPANDAASKFERFIAFSSFMVADHYAIRAALYKENINVQNQVMPVLILDRYEVAIRPCELNNFAKIFGYSIEMSGKLAEYKGLMEFLTKTGLSLTEFMMIPDNQYELIWQGITAKSKSIKFQDPFDEAREIVRTGKPGCNVVRYLAQIMRNKVLKDQYYDEQCGSLSDLYLSFGCIPFDKMPFATSLKGHNPEMADVFASIPVKGREYELLSRYLQTNTSSYGHLYTSRDDLKDFHNLDSLISTYNRRLYYKHTGRRIEQFGNYLYINEFFDDTKVVLQKLLELSENGISGYRDSVDFWMTMNPEIVNCEEKKEILLGMFENTRVSMIYGAAGTGKTYLLNHVAQFFDDKKKLFLANTNPAVDNLRRKVKSQNCDFKTIAKFIKNSRTDTQYDILFIDECSMVSNSDMKVILEKAKFKLLVLVGDTYQIESITFGNWFSLARYFLPKKTWNELLKPYRAQNEELLELWTNVRKMKEDITEHIVFNKYSSALDETIFQRESNDEIILCLNYNGIYGINNINRFLQNSNPNPSIRWGLWDYKIGDPVLFNDNERFAPLLYNNLKGTIVDIQVDTVEDRIWFSIELEKVLNELDVEGSDIELLPKSTSKGSIIRFYVDNSHDFEGEDDTEITTVVPFQIAYAVSIHKAQGLEYDSVKVVITEDIDQMITHNIFYTAITRAKKKLKIYWSPESQQRVVSRFQMMNTLNDANIFAGHSHMKKTKFRE